MLSLVLAVFWLGDGIIIWGFSSFMTQKSKSEYFHTKHGNLLNPCLRYLLWGAVLQHLFRLCIKDSFILIATYLLCCGLLWRGNRRELTLILRSELFERRYLSGTQYIRHQLHQEVVAGWRLERSSLHVMSAMCSSGPIVSNPTGLMSTRMSAIAWDFYLSISYYLSIAYYVCITNNNCLILLFHRGDYTGCSPFFHEQMDGCHNSLRHVSLAKQTVRRSPTAQLLWSRWFEQIKSDKRSDTAWKQW